jgi:hypothetical protein
MDNLLVINEFKSLSQFLDEQCKHDSLVGRLARGEALAGIKLHAACKRAAFMYCGSSNWNDVLSPRAPRKTQIGTRLLELLGSSAPLALHEAAKRFQKVKVRKEE